MKTTTMMIMVLLVLGGCSAMSGKVADITNKVCSELSQPERDAFTDKVNAELADTGNQFLGVSCKGDE